MGWSLTKLRSAMFMSKSEMGPLIGHPQAAAAAPRRFCWKIGALIIRPLPHHAMRCRNGRGSLVNKGIISGRSRIKPCAKAPGCNGTGRKLIVRMPRSRAAIEAGAHMPWNTMSGFNSLNAASWPSMKDFAISSDPKNSGQSHPRSCATDIPFTRG